MPAQRGSGSKSQQRMGSWRVLAALLCGTSHAQDRAASPVGSSSQGVSGIEAVLPHM